MLRHVAKYEKATSHYVIEHEESYPGKSLLEPKGEDEHCEEHFYSKEFD